LYFRFPLSFIKAKKQFTLLRVKTTPNAQGTQSQVLGASHQLDLKLLDDSQKEIPFSTTQKIAFSVPKIAGYWPFFDPATNKKYKSAATVEAKARLNTRNNPNTCLFVANETAPVSQKYSTAGCAVLNSTNSSVVCECSHFTKSLIRLDVKLIKEKYADALLSGSQNYTQAAMKANMISLEAYWKEKVNEGFAPVNDVSSFQSGSGFMTLIDHLNGIPDTRRTDKWLAQMSNLNQTQL
jgi:hypothetical protein